MALAVELDPASVDFLCRLALQYEREKDPERALVTYRRALALEPKGEVALRAVERLTASKKPSQREGQPA